MMKCNEKEELSLGREIVKKIQQTKMKELWDNKEDETWEHTLWTH